MMEDEKRKKRFERCRVLFRNKVTPTELLPYLDCLTTSMKEQVERWEDREGPQNAAYKLSLQVVKKDNWYEDLIYALRETNNDKLADEIDGISSASAERRNNTNATNQRGAAYRQGETAGRMVNGTGGRNTDGTNHRTSGGGISAHRDTAGGGESGGGADGGTERSGGWHADGGSDTHGSSRTSGIRRSGSRTETAGIREDDTGACGSGGATGGITSVALEANRQCRTSPPQRRSQAAISLQMQIEDLPCGVGHIFETLNNPSPISRNNWRGLASAIYISYSDMQKIERSSNPTQEVLNKWHQMPGGGATLEALLEILASMEREDIIEALEEELHIQWDRPLHQSESQSTHANDTPHRERALEPEASVKPSHPGNSSDTMATNSQHASSAKQNSLAPPGIHSSIEAAENQDTTIGAGSRQQPSFNPDHPRHETTSPGEAFNTATAKDTSETSEHDKKLPKHVQSSQDVEKHSNLKTKVTSDQASEIPNQNEASNQNKPRNATSPQDPDAVGHQQKTSVIATRPVYDHKSRNPLTASIQRNLDQPSGSSDQSSNHHNSTHEGTVRHQPGLNILESETDNNGSQCSSNSSSRSKSGLSKGGKGDSVKPDGQSPQGYGSPVEGDTSSATVKSEFCNTEDIPHTLVSHEQFDDNLPEGAAKENNDKKAPEIYRSTDSSETASASTLQQAGSQPPLVVKLEVMQNQGQQPEHRRHTASAKDISETTEYKEKVPLDIQTSLDVDKPSESSDQSAALKQHNSNYSPQPQHQEPVRHHQPGCNIVEGEADNGSQSSGHSSSCTKSGPSKDGQSPQGDQVVVDRHPPANTSSAVDQFQAEINSIMNREDGPSPLFSQELLANLPGGTSTKNNDAELRSSGLLISDESAETPSTNTQADSELPQVYQPEHRHNTIDEMMQVRQQSNSRGNQRAPAEPERHPILGNQTPPPPTDEKAIHLEVSLDNEYNESVEAPNTQHQIMQREQNPVAVPPIVANRDEHLVDPQTPPHNRGGAVDPSLLSQNRPPSAAEGTTHQVPALQQSPLSTQDVQQVPTANMAHESQAQDTNQSENGEAEGSDLRAENSEPSTADVGTRHSMMARVGLVGATLASMVANTKVWWN